MSILIISTIASNAVRSRIYKNVLADSTPSSGILLRTGQYPVYVKKLTSDEVGKRWDDVKNEAWQIPIDPIVSVSGKNIIAKRNVSKTNQKNWRGSIKELWSQDDYSINISGTLLGENADNDLLKIKDIINYQGDVYLHCNLFEQLDIYSLIVESFDFKEPHTGRYDYTLHCVSDDSYDLLINS